MAGRLDGRVAVITGGCSGIGLATVRRFLEEGAKVVIGDVDDARGEELVSELGVTYVHVDVTSKEQVDALFKTAKDTYGSVDIAFNNAGCRRSTSRASTCAARRSFPTCSSRAEGRSSTRRRSLQ